LHLPPGNDEGGYNNKDIPIIPALDLGEAADHFLAMAILLSAFSLLSSSLSKAVAAAAGQRGDQGFVAISIGNDNDGVKQKVDNDDFMTWFQATARPPSPSPPTPDAKVAIVTTQIVTMTTMHPAAAAQIKGETTRALKIGGGTTRGTDITTQSHATTNKRRAQQEVEPLVERWREATGQHNNHPNKRGAME
jgi:hypothetical protein